MENGSRVRPWKGIFKQKFFPVLIGAVSVLGKDFEMNISETLEKGSYQLAKKKITLHTKQSEMKGV